MLDYDLFKEMVYKDFTQYIPDAFKSREPVFMSVNKINQTRDCIGFKEKFEGETVPILYVDDMYESYKVIGDFQEIMKMHIENMCKALGKKEHIPDFYDKEHIKENIVFQLINREQNKEMLQGIPHRDMEDLSIIYRIIVKMDEEGIGSAIIDNGLAKMSGITEEELFAFAKENTKKILPTQVMPLHELLKEQMIAEGMPEELFEIMMGEMPKKEMMYVITNQMQINGAAAILYDESLHEVAETFGSDLFIIPSSIHEVIAVSADMGKPEDLAQMVLDVNMNMVQLSERLSNQIYHYDKELRKLSLATDTPNKRLDANVAESVINYDAQQLTGR